MRLHLIPLLSFALLLVAACNDETRRAGGANTNRDGSVVIPPSSDGSQDTGSGDAGDDGGTNEIGCEVDESGIVLVESSGVFTADPPALVAQNEGAYITYVAIDGGKKVLRSRWFPVSPMSSPRGYDTGGATEEAREPTMIRTGPFAGVLFRADVEGETDLFSGMIGSDASGPATRLNVPPSEIGPPHSPAFAQATETSMILWLEGTEASQVGFAWAHSSIGPLEAPVAIDALADALARPTMAAVEGGFAVGFVGRASKRPRWLRLSNAGEPQGDIADLSTEATATGWVESTTTSSGGAVVWEARVAGTRPEVRFRTFDGSGVVRGREEVVTPAPETGTGASITPIHGGYAISYRGKGNGGDATMLRVAFVDAMGGPIGTLDVSPLAPPSRATSIRSSPDGRYLFVLFTDDLALRLARIRCD